MPPSKSAPTESISHTIKLYLHVLAHTILHLIFLSIWLISQYYFDKFLHLFQINGVESYVLEIFKAMFALTSLYPILMTTYKFFRILTIQYNKEINKAKK